MDGEVLGAEAVGAREDEERTVVVGLARAGCHVSGEGGVWEGRRRTGGLLTR